MDYGGQMSSKETVSSYRLVHENMLNHHDCREAASCVFFGQDTGHCSWFRPARWTRPNGVRDQPVLEDVPHHKLAEMLQTSRKPTQVEVACCGSSR